MDAGWPRLSRALRVLIIDDGAIEADIIARLLRSQGCRAETCAPSEAVIQLWAAKNEGAPYEAILMTAGIARGGGAIIAQAGEACGPAGEMRAIVLIDPFRAGRGG